MSIVELLQVSNAYEQLDDLVIQTACEEASKINNGGVRRQIEYLLEAGWTEKQIQAALTDEELSLEDESEGVDNESLY